MLHKIISKTVAAVRSNKGISALEYGILAAVLIGAVTLAAQALSTDLGTAFSTIGNTIKTTASNAASAK